MSVGQLLSQEPTLRFLKPRTPRRSSRSPACLPQLQEPEATPEAGWESAEDSDVERRDALSTGGRADPSAPVAAARCQPTLRFGPGIGCSIPQQHCYRQPHARLPGSSAHLRATLSARQRAKAGHPPLLVRDTALER